MPTADDLLKKLAEWEERKDHGLPDGFILIDARLNLWSDGSGEVEVETAPVRLLDGEDEFLAGLRAVLGLNGLVNRFFTFDDYTEGLEILSRPFSESERLNNAEPFVETA